jgi:hypothetical protein
LSYTAACVQFARAQAPKTDSGRKHARTSKSVALTIFMFFALHP